MTDKWWNFSVVDGCSGLQMESFISLNFYTWWSLKCAQKKVPIEFQSGLSYAKHAIVLHLQEWSGRL